MMLVSIIKGHGKEVCSANDTYIYNGNFRSNQFFIGKWQIRSIESKLMCARLLLSI